MPKDISSQKRALALFEREAAQSEYPMMCMKIRSVKSTEIADATICTLVDRVDYTQLRMNICVISILGGNFPITLKERSEGQNKIWRSGGSNSGPSAHQLRDAKRTLYH